MTLPKTSCAAVNNHLAAIQHNKEYEYFEEVVSLNKGAVFSGADKKPEPPIPPGPGPSPDPKPANGKASTASVKL